jgi:coenzyme Q-binding protein COQ10
MPTHSETRVLPYTPQQMYDLVADVRSYPEFLPWTAAARIRSETPVGSTVVMLADLVISSKVFRERFGSRVVLHPEERRIETSYVDGPFRHMESVWTFAEDPGGVAVGFDVDFEFRSRLLQGAAGMFFNDAMQRIVRAFERRAAVLYGPQARSA